MNALHMNGNGDDNSNNNCDVMYDNNNVNMIENSNGMNDMNVRVNDNEENNCNKNNIVHRNDCNEEIKKSLS